jgi:hypothetical protein
MNKWKLNIMKRTDNCNLLTPFLVHFLVYGKKALLGSSCPSVRPSVCLSVRPWPHVFVDEKMRSLSLTAMNTKLYFLLKILRKNSQHCRSRKKNVKIENVFIEVNERTRYLRIQWPNPICFSMQVTPIFFISLTSSSGHLHGIINLSIKCMT